MTVDLLIPLTCLCRNFGADITSWATFNEPGVYTFSGYCMGSFPPGKHFHFGLAGRVMKHMMICHAEAYNLIKSLPGKPISATSMGSCLA